MWVVGEVLAHRDVLPSLPLKVRAGLLTIDQGWLGRVEHVTFCLR